MISDVVVHELSMRFADLDSLNHINNVVYLDYAAEARALLIDDDIVLVDEIPTRIAIDFLRPMLLSRDPVRIESRREGDELFQTIRPSRAGTDFARVRTVMGGANTSSRRAGAAASSLHLRRSDLDQSGVVRTDKMFELFQECRIPALDSALTSMSIDRFVVARVEVEYGRPIAWRRDPYGVLTWVNRIGTSSVTLVSQIVDGDAVVAQSHTTVVGFDLQTQRSRHLSAQEKAELETLLPTA